MKPHIIIAVDFDGTCVKHKYPDVGEDVPYAVKTLLALAENSHKIILYTMRSNEPLLHAVNWFKSNNIPLYEINKNPSQRFWTNSPKVYANLYIDDAAYGCPLKHDIGDERPYVDWVVIYKDFKNQGLIK